MHMFFFLFFRLLNLSPCPHSRQIVVILSASRTEFICALCILTDLDYQLKDYGLVFMKMTMKHFPYGMTRQVDQD